MLEGNSEVLKDGHSRIDQLDYAKAIGIFLVVLGHCILLDDKENVVSRWIYSFHMPLFFVIAGFGIKLGNNIDGKGFVKKNIKRLIIPYICWSLLYITVFVFTDGLSTLIDNVYKTATGRGVAPLWFLPALFLAKMVFGLILKLNGKTRIPDCVFWGGTLFFVGILSVIASEVFFELENISLIIKYPIVTLFRIIPSVFYIAVGWFTCGWLTTKKSFEIRFLLAVVATICFVFVNVIFPNDANMHTFQIQSMAVFLLSGTIGSIALISLVFLLTDGIRILSVIGRESISIMALHYPPIPIIYGVNLLCGLIGIYVPFFLRAIGVIAVAHVVLKIFDVIKNWIFGEKLNA